MASVSCRAFGQSFTPLSGSYLPSSEIRSVALKYPLAFLRLLLKRQQVNSRAAARCGSHDRRREIQSNLVGHSPGPRELSKSFYRDPLAQVRFSLAIASHANPSRYSLGSQPRAQFRKRRAICLPALLRGTASERPAHAE